MKRLGNACVNAFLEFKLPANQKLSSDAQSSARSDFIRTKYVDRKWAADSADFCADFQKLGIGVGNMGIPDPGFCIKESQIPIPDFQNRSQIPIQDPGKFS